MSAIDLSQHKSTVASKQVPPFMTDTYTVRCNKQKFGPSGKGQPMITLGFEVIEPQSIVRNDIEYDLTSLEPQMYVCLWATDKFDGIQQAREFHEKLGLPLTIDIENPDLKIYDGLTFKVILSSSEIIRQRVVGKDEKGKPTYEAIKGDDGEPIKLGWQLNPISGRDIIKRAEAPSNRPF